MTSVESFVESLSDLLPEGFAWPRDPSSVLMRTIRGIAGSFEELHRFTHATVAQWQPYTTTLRMGEWELACGLPDVCFGAGQDFQQRRSLLLRTLRGVDLPYEDSSPAAPAVLEAMCAELGIEAVVTYNTPYRVGRDRVGRRLGLLNGKLYVSSQVLVPRFRVGVNRVGQRLVPGTNTEAQLLCYLRRVAPARFELNVNFYE